MPNESMAAGHLTPRYGLSIPCCLGQFLYAYQTVLWTGVQISPVGIGANCPRLAIMVVVPHLGYPMTAKSNTMLLLSAFTFSY